jgi:hypothetical protein
MDPYREANRRLWEEWAAIHPRAEFYRVEDFKRGWEPLKPFEVEELLRDRHQDRPGTVSIMATKPA